MQNGFAPVLTAPVPEDQDLALQGCSRRRELSIFFGATTGAQASETGGKTCTVTMYLN